MENEPIAEELTETPAPLVTPRGFLILISLLVVLLGSSASHLYDLNNAQLTLIAAHLGTLAIAFAAFVFVYGSRRRRLEKEAGPLLEELNRDWNRLFTAWDHDAIIVIGFFLLQMSIRSFLEDLDALSGNGNATILNWQMTLPLLAAATILICIGLWDFDLLQMRRNGAILGLTYTPWNKLKTCRWSTHEQNVLLIGWGTIYKVPVSSRDRPKVDQVLSTVLAERQSAPKA
ncbi:hypothetical protein LOC68_22685 [Blastopirellula sp. JC732]|uniref:DUF5673 domain-containing protein n=1 Tax=Blastopirellula sediminis TaxID=2894196 RepID=A0A9X1MR92_9BACT|nr:hypothetical protein [Blastopirellula sediminis]MCC9605491.1 hypothetical protein [Blastopirellula sediminis]MCC9631209.1 hypothetical protein [Blastopirellula sediminis]